MSTSLSRQSSDENPTKLLGFQLNPLKFLISAKAWRVIAWSLFQGLLLIPLLISCILLAPFLPEVYYRVDQLQRRGATWLGVAIPQGATAKKRWLDTKQSSTLAGHLGISFAALLISAILMPLIVATFLTPFFWSFAPPGAGVHLIIWSTESAPLVALFSWSLSWCTLLLYLYFSWGLAATSVRITAVANRDSDKEIQQLTQSRTTLIDAFTGERRRIERELHDGAQQYLTALQLNIAAVELAATQSPQLHAEILEPLNQAKANAHEALVALRATVRGIYSQVLADKGIVEALQELVAHSGVAGELNASAKKAPYCHPPKRYCFTTAVQKELPMPSNMVTQPQCY